MSHTAFTAEDWIKTLELRTHPEGGYFRETYRSMQQLAPVAAAQPLLAQAAYPAGTSIYFLLRSEQKGDFSAWHRLTDSDELWFFQAGNIVTTYWLQQDGTLITKKLGMGGDCLHIVIPKGHWFAATVEDPNPQAYTLVGCACFPGFDFAEFELAKRELLIAQFPQHRTLIERLTRS